MCPLTRRRILLGSLSLPMLWLAGEMVEPALAAAKGLKLGPPQPFDFESLRAMARVRATQPYEAPRIRFKEVLERLDYDAHGQIRYRPGYALWADQKGPYPVQFLHLGQHFKLPVKCYVVSDGTAREITYSRKVFDYGTTDFARDLPDDLGFAGFRVMAPDSKSDWLSFLGASYFRSSGALGQYGMSARGLAVNTGLSAPEEFPRFTDFWLAPVDGDPNAMVVGALLEGPSVSGAYLFRIVRNQAGVIMDVDAALFCRADVERLGVAPLTSMFWYSETNRPQAIDWRPEIHDSDGLAVWTSTGERIWRPLNNPLTVQTNSFIDTNPRGFGLVQRDRNFENYVDGVFYDRRPSVWVEPIGDWGEGAVQLVEIPSDDEVYDNIVAYWWPKAPAKAGSAWQYRYRVYWVAQEPFPGALGHVIATRVGRGGLTGSKIYPKDKKKLVIDFEGGPLDRLQRHDPVEAVISASRGTIDDVEVLQVLGTKRWRAMFDLKAPGSEPVDLRCFLRSNHETLTESWLYQHFPLEFGARS